MKEKKITTDQFELYEPCILSNQLEHSEIVRLLAENPEFEKWLKERARKVR
jgi:hypothetical protein